MEYPLLRALATEWDAALRGAGVTEVFSQDRDELSITLAAAAGECTLRMRCTPGRPLIWRVDGAGRARRNTASVLGALEGKLVAGVRVAERDRHLFLDLEDDGCLQVMPFGPRPNVLLSDGAGVIVGAFLRETEWLGRAAPAPRPARWPDTAEEFRAGWPGGKSAGEALARTMPSLGRTHAREAVRRAGVDPAASAELAGAVLDRILAAAVALDAEILARPAPTVYLRGSLPEAISLVVLTDPPAGWEFRTFPTVDAAVRGWAVGNLAAENFLSRYRPLESALAGTAERLERGAGAMAEELARPSRADRHERDAHLLMAHGAGEGPGRDRISLPDILDPDAGEAPALVEIALDPALSIVENAQRLYARARETRAARTHAENRWAHTVAKAERAAELVAELRGLAAGDGSVRGLEAWRINRAEDLADFTRGDASGSRLPYRRFELPGGWEVRVGRSARDNAELTSRHAGPHDLWLHARGVSGSHVILRRPARTAVPGREVIEAAAALAAYYSRARTQSMVPVIVTERKYVRPIRGGAPGLVRVDREDVVIVEPRGMG